MRPHGRTLVIARALATALAAASAAPTQSPAPSPEVHAAFAAESASSPPALTYLRQHLLATRADWPADRAAAQPFTVHFVNGTLRTGDGLPLPKGIAFAGEGTFGDTTVQFACDEDGREDWVVRGSSAPLELAMLLAALQLVPGAPPRSIDVPALVGNLTGATVDGDDAAQNLLLAAVQCGELTLIVRPTADRWTVRGRSGGGLSVPALLAYGALRRVGAATPVQRGDGWRLRAFGGRDGDRAEAARQLQRDGAPGIPALRALLHADEASRVSAIDGLLRLGAASELPRIVAAADAAMPLAVAIAAAAVRDLWPTAGPTTRNATLAALRASTTLDPSLVTAAAPPTAIDPRYRWIALLAIASCGLFGLWWRERARTT